MYLLNFGGTSDILGVAIYEFYDLGSNGNESCDTRGNAYASVHIVLGICHVRRSNMQQLSSSSSHVTRGEAKEWLLTSSWATLSSILVNARPLCSTSHQ